MAFKLFLGARVAGGGATQHDVTGANSSQANQGSAAAIAQTHLIGAANSKQANVASQGSTVQAYSAPADVFIVAGQSNPCGRATDTVQPVSTNFVALQYDRSDAWKPLQESATQVGSFDEQSGAGGSFFGALSNRIQALSRPCGFAPRGVGSTTISQWQRYAPNPTSMATLYGRMLTAANNLGTHTALMFWQGESDENTDPTTYEAALNQMINDWYADTGKPTFLIKICQWKVSTGVAAIRQAQQNVIDTNPHVIGSADANVYYGNVHYLTTTEINAVADAVYAGMVSAFYATKVTAANSTQANTAQSAAIRQTHNVTAANSNQPNVGTPGSATQSSTSFVVGSNSAQGNAASAGAVRQTHLIVSAGAAVDNIASASAIVQTHLVGGANSTQSNTASAAGILPPTGAVTLTPADIAAVVAAMPSAADIAAAVWAYAARSMTTAERNAIAATVLAAAQVSPIHADGRMMNGSDVIGDGTELDPWRGVGVSP